MARKLSHDKSEIIIRKLTLPNNIVAIRDFSLQQEPKNKIELKEAINSPAIYNFGLYLSLKEESNVFR